MRILFRTDASVALGTGHVMRCLALSQAMQSTGDEAQFVSADLPEGLAGRLQAEGVQVRRLTAERASSVDAETTLALATEWSADTIVLDGRNFDSRYQATLKTTGMSVVVIDDEGQPDNESADVIINPNLDASAESYAGSNAQTQLIGRRFALLRKEFWSREERAVSLRTRRVLITMGGADPDNVSGKVVRALKRSTIEQLELRVVVGPANPYLETLRHQASRDGHSVVLLDNVSNMREQMEWADVAVSASGNTALELACVGLAGIYITIADNQESVARSIRKHGFGKVLGWHEDVSEEQIRGSVRDLLSSSEERDRMAQWGRELVDGQGALRVASALRDGC